ncbi:MAG: hypothetical protein Q9O24_10465 [Gammaproteobacteria bacterium]|nr:hypothetical protein [Gammaproteobacteria bacterium]MDQ7075548.1 hypothetical protein [Gammaproteobacteria bacterium]
MRVKTRWNQKDRDRSTEHVATAIGIAIWKIGQTALLEIENEGFQTDTQCQRLDVLAEFSAFLIQVVDRSIYGKKSEEERQIFVSALALYMVDFYAENRADFEPEIDHRSNFVALLNERMADYAQSDFSEEDGPSYVMRRNFGNNVAKILGEKDNKWVPDYIMDIQVPKALPVLKRALVMLK